MTFVNATIALRDPHWSMPLRLPVRRIAVALVVVLGHLIVVLWLAHVGPQLGSPTHRLREFVFLLSPPRPPVHPSPKKRHRPRADVRVPAVPSFSLPRSWLAPDVSGVGRSLFSCQPATHDDHQTQPANCAGSITLPRAPAPQDFKPDIEQHPHWADAYAEEKAPSAGPSEECRDFADTGFGIKMCSKRADPQTQPQ